MDGLAQGFVFEEVHLAGVDCGRKERAGGANPARRKGANLLGDTNFDNMTGFAALDEEQSAAGDEAAQGPARGVAAKPSAASEPIDGKAYAGLSFQAAVAQEMRIDGPISRRQAQARNKVVLELFPDECGVGFFVFHVPIQEELMDKWQSKWAKT
jgi:hypothetical protein